MVSFFLGAAVVALLVFLLAPYFFTIGVPRGRKILGTLLVASLTAGTGVLYERFGAPQLSDMGMNPTSMQAQQPAMPEMSPELKEAVQALHADPKDASLWQELGRVLRREGRLAEAVAAYGQAAHLSGEQPEYLLEYVKTRVLASNGMVDDEVRTLMAQLTEALPNNAELKFFRGLMAMQDGDTDTARELWASALSELEEGTPVFRMTQMYLGRLDAENIPQENDE